MNRSTFKDNRHISLMVACVLCLVLLTTSTESALAGDLSKIDAEKYFTYRTNSVHCVEVAIPFEVNGGVPGTVTYYYIRPAGINLETLSNSQLDGCGISERPTGKGNDSFRSYQDWLGSARRQLAWHQPDPWLPGLKIGDVRQGGPSLPPGYGFPNFPPHSH